MEVGKEGKNGQTIPGDMSETNWSLGPFEQKCYIMDNKKKCLVDNAYTFIIFEKKRKKISSEQMAGE